MFLEGTGVRFPRHRRHSLGVMVGEEYEAGQDLVVVGAWTEQWGCVVYALSRLVGNWRDLQAPLN